MKRASILLALLALPGCFLARSSINDPVHAASVSTLIPGQSTQAEVLAALGAPTEVVQLSRRSAWRYDHAVQKRTALWLLLVVLSNEDTQSDRVWCFFDENSVLMCVGSSLHSADAVYELPWSDSHGSTE